MTKKSLIVFSIFCIITLLSMPIFAANGAENTLNNIKDGVQNMANDAGRAMEGVKDGAENVVSDIGNGARNVGEAAKNTMQDMTRTDNNYGNSRGYNVARTSATNAANGLNDAMVWVILGVTGAIIIALVWYYGRQSTHDDRY